MATIGLLQYLSLVFGIGVPIRSLYKKSAHRQNIKQVGAEVSLAHFWN